MITELEGVKDPRIEGAESTPEKEGAESTPPKGEPTVGKTYTQFELDKALGKGLESINRQLSQRDKALAAKNEEFEEFKRTSSAQIEDLQANLEDTQSEHQQAMKALEDPDIKTAYTDRAILRKREREAARREKIAEDKLYKAETLVYKQGLEAKAKILHEETGIPIKELDDCKTDDEMEVKSLRYKLSHPDEKEAEKQRDTEEQKFDSGASSGSGGMPEHPTVEQMEKWTPEQFAKWAERRYK